MSTGDEVLSKLKWVSLVCLLFMTGELIGGWIANSIAIMSDAMHLMSDLMAFAVSAYSVWLAKQPPPKYLSHGYQKAETLGALINIAVIWVVTLLLLVEATERVVNKEVVKEPGYMLITSVLGLLCNLVMVKILHGDENFKHEGCNHGNSHNHSNEEVHQHNGKPNGRPTKLAVSNGSQEDLGDTPLQSSPSSWKSPHELFSSLEEARPIHVCSGDHHHHHEQHVPEDALAAFQASPNNLNIEAAYVHILGDIILSVGVIVAASIIYFLTEKGGPWNYYHLADPLCTYLFSVLVVMTTFRITKKSIVILLDGCLDQQLVGNIEEQLKPYRYSELKVWSVNSEKNRATIITEQTEPQRLARIRNIFERLHVEVLIGRND